MGERKPLDIIKLDTRKLLQPTAKLPIYDSSLDRIARSDQMKQFLDCILKNGTMVEYPLLCLHGIGKNKGAVSAYLGDFDRFIDVPREGDKFQGMVDNLRNSVFEEGKYALVTILDLTYNSHDGSSLFDRGYEALRLGSKNHIKHHVVEFGGGSLADQRREYNKKYFMTLYKKS